MAMVYGQSYSAASMTEFKGGAGAAATEEDSDDEEYVYVSTLAEQIAAHAMLDEEDDLPPTRLQYPAMHRNGDVVFANCAEEAKLQKKTEYMKEVENPVSRFAAVWRDHGPSEWECFYTPSLQLEVSKQASILNSQLHQIDKLQGWTSLHNENAKQAGSQPQETWGLHPHRRAQPIMHQIPLLRRKESIGTGVFLPKVVSTGLHYRRKAGLSKPAYSARGKLL